jgi:tRNA dimethylallyltransferase
MHNNYNCILIVGATASGKTQLATQVAQSINAEIISIDSRQVYNELTIGAGKDLSEYKVNNVTIPYHLINVIGVNDDYYIHNYLKDYTTAFTNITAHCKPVVLCGGTAMYLHCMLTNAQYTGVPVNQALRAALQPKTIDDLNTIYTQLTPLSHVDVKNHKRIIRAIEIQQYLATNPHYEPLLMPKLKPLIIGLNSDVNTRRNKILTRLNNRLNNGLIQEVEQLLSATTTPERLIHMGLEYKYITFYLLKKITYTELQSQLFTAICQYAKAQMTWLRKLERDGNIINWLDVDVPLHEKLNIVSALWQA